VRKLDRAITYFVEQSVRKKVFNIDTWSFAFREMSGTTTPSITTERTSALNIKRCCAESGNRQRVAMLSAVASLSGIVH
jgi:hypothetical protein